MPSSSPKRITIVRKVSEDETISLEFKEGGQWNERVSIWVNDKNITCSEYGAKAFAHMFKNFESELQNNLL